MNRVLRRLLRARLARLAGRLSARLPHAAVWPEQIDDQRGELRLLAPRRLKPFLSKLLERTR